MSRKPAFSLAYDHEKAFAAKMTQAFSVPAGIPSRMRAILDRLDAAANDPTQSLADRLQALRELTEAEAANAPRASRLRA